MGKPVAAALAPDPGSGPGLSTSAGAVSFGIRGGTMSEKKYGIVVHTKEGKAWAFQDGRIFIATLENATRQAEKWTTSDADLDLPDTTYTVRLIVDGIGD